MKMFKKVVPFWIRATLFRVLHRKKSHSKGPLTMIKIFFSLFYFLMGKKKVGEKIIKFQRETFSRLFWYGKKQKLLEALGGLEMVVVGLELLFSPLKIDVNL